MYLRRDERATNVERGRTEGARSKEKGRTWGEPRVKGNRRRVRSGNRDPGFVESKVRIPMRNARKLAPRDANGEGARGARDETQRRPRRKPESEGGKGGRRRAASSQDAKWSGRASAGQGRGEGGGGRRGRGSGGDRNNNPVARCARLRARDRLMMQPAAELHRVLLLGTSTRHMPHCCGALGPSLLPSCRRFSLALPSSPSPSLSAATRRAPFEAREINVRLVARRFSRSSATNHRRTGRRLVLR